MIAAPVQGDVDGTLSEPGRGLRALPRSSKCTAISDRTRNQCRDDDSDDEIGSRHANEMATKAGQCRAEDERNGWGDDVFHGAQ